MKIVIGLLALIVAGRALPEERPLIDPQMKKLFTAMLNLQPFAVSPEMFSNPANREIIEHDLDTLAGLRHNFPRRMAIEEPGLAAITEIYTGYLDDARARFREGNTEYARHRLRTLPGFCLSCHTRVSGARDFADVENRIAKARLAPFAKAQLFAATRQFDTALASFRAILLSAPKDELALLDYVHALRHFLFVAVRVKQDPKLTAELLDKLAGRKDLPEFVRRLVASYRADAVFWRKQPIVSRDLTGEALVRHARELVERALSSKMFSADESGDISLLRATNYLHEAMNRDVKAAYRGEALYLLGISYHALQDPLLWEMDALYLQACIRENPHRPIARDCYAKYASYLYAGYTGSAGTHVPADELERLKSLRALSE